MNSRYLGVAAFLGVLFSSILALAFRINISAIRNGLYGYNGILVGIAIALFHFGDDTNWTKMT